MKILALVLALAMTGCSTLNRGELRMVNSWQDSTHRRYMAWGEMFFGGAVRLVRAAREVPERRVTEVPRARRMPRMSAETDGSWAQESRDLICLQRHAGDATAMGVCFRTNDTWGGVYP